MLRCKAPLRGSSVKSSSKVATKGMRGVAVTGPRRTNDFLFLVASLGQPAAAVPQLGPSCEPTNDITKAHSSDNKPVVVSLVAHFDGWQLPMLLWSITAFQVFNIRGEQQPGCACGTRAAFAPNLSWLETDWKQREAFGMSLDIIWDSKPAEAECLSEVGIAEWIFLLDNSGVTLQKQKKYFLEVKKEELSVFL